MNRPIQLWRGELSAIFCQLRAPFSSRVPQTDSVGRQAILGLQQPGGWGSGRRHGVGVDAWAAAPCSSMETASPTADGRLLKTVAVTLR